MTARFKDFGKGVGTNNDEPIVFRLHEEEFQCRAQLQGKTMLKFVVDSTSEDPSVSARMVNSFFESVLLPESYERFEALTSDPERVVSMETLGEITSWLLEGYAGRPETQPEAS